MTAVAAERSVVGMGKSSRSTEAATCSGGKNKERRGHEGLREALPPCRPEHAAPGEERRS